jgi:hypothetical protein
MNFPVQMTGVTFADNSVHFANQDIFKKQRTPSTENCDINREFIKHFRTAIATYPPIGFWGVAVMGNVNMIYRNLIADKIRKRHISLFRLATSFGILDSSLTLLRNACCHHSRGGTR